MLKYDVEQVSALARTRQQQQAQEARAAAQQVAQRRARTRRPATPCQPAAAAYTPPRPPHTRWPCGLSEQQSVMWCPWCLAEQAEREAAEAKAAQMVQRLAEAEAKLAQKLAPSSSPELAELEGTGVVQPLSLEGGVEPSEGSEAEPQAGQQQPGETEDERWLRNAVQQAEAGTAAQQTLELGQQARALRQQHVADYYATKQWFQVCALLHMDDACCPSSVTKRVWLCGRI
jgi:hypothetical protein|eukprot:COSAG01_NODE_9605_length_2393_cov_133.876199_3_plen_231_part_00